ncbi:MAG: surface-adhesin E family protein [Syntrophales bacterium]
MRKYQIFFVILVVAALFWSIPAAAQQKDGRWTLAGFTKYQDGVFVDGERRSVPSPGHAAAWIRVAPRGKSPYFKEIRNYLASAGVDPRTFRAIEILCEYDCAGNRIRFLRYVYLNRNWNPIHEAAEPAPPWHSVQPGSLWDKVQQPVCRPEK